VQRRRQERSRRTRRPAREFALEKDPDASCERFEVPLLGEIAGNDVDDGAPSAERD
jgi:hypothetical protein